MFGLFKCKGDKKKTARHAKPIKSSHLKYAEPGMVIGLPSPTGDSTPIPTSRKKSSTLDAEPRKSSFKDRGSSTSRGKKPSVTWDDQDVDYSIDLIKKDKPISLEPSPRRESSSKRESSSRASLPVDDRRSSRAIGSSTQPIASSSVITLGGTEPIRTSKTGSGSSKSDKTQCRSSFGDLVEYGKGLVGKITKGNVEPLRPNPKLNKVKELYNENLAATARGGSGCEPSERFSSRRISASGKDCTLRNKSSSGKQIYFERDVKEHPQVFRNVKSHEEYIKEEEEVVQKKPSKKSNIFNSGMISNCLPMYGKVQSLKDDEACDINLSSNFMNAKNKIMHRQHSAGTMFFNNRLSNGWSKGHVEGRGPGCASLATNPVYNSTIIRSRGHDSDINKGISKGDTFCYNGSGCGESEDSSIIYRLSKGISGLQTSTYVLPERPYLKRNSLDYTRDSKLYYIKTKAEHQRREKERQAKLNEGAGYYDNDGEFVDLVPPPYLRSASSTEEVVKKPSMWDRCCPH